MENEQLTLTVLLVGAFLVVLNGIQISTITSHLSMTGSSVFAGSASAGRIDFSAVDVNSITSTAAAIASLFPELETATSVEDVMSIMLPEGTPEYSDALGGITFDDPVNSMEYLAKWYYSLSSEVKNNDPELWKRYINLAAAPRGISCEFCCGVGPQGITKDGKLRCGCKHNPAVQALTLGLMKYTDYTDAQILREVMRWKAMFFPKNMVGLASQLAGV